MRNAICCDHDDIYEAVQHIYLLSRMIQNSDDLGEINDAAAKIENYANDIESAVISAKASGQAMENRLADYCHTIEGLGFVRRK